MDSNELLVRCDATYVVLHVVERDGILLSGYFARRDGRVSGPQDLFGGAAEHRELDRSVSLGVDVNRGAADVVAAVIVGLDRTRAPIRGRIAGEGAADSIPDLIGYV